MAATEEEAEHFECVARAFERYGARTEAWVARCEAQFAALPARHRAILDAAGVRARHAALRTAARQNAQFCQLLADEHRRVFGGEDGNGSALLSAASERLADSEFYGDKVRTTLTQMARDWSAEGRAERDAAYGPLLGALQRRWPARRLRRDVRVLTPGAGLGRLTFEVSRLGFDSQGNEFSYFMLLGSSVVLNRTSRVGEHVLRPWIRHSVNVRAGAEQLREVCVPDVVPGEESGGSGPMSMTAGDFLDVYGDDVLHAGKWDCVCTCFFLDTAHNALDYVDRIHKLLRPGGFWINLGPLLWHFADMPDERSVELTWEELRAAIAASGFHFEQEKTVRASYDHDSFSLMSVVYNCIFFVAAKAN